MFGLFAGGKPPDGASIEAIIAQKDEEIEDLKLKITALQDALHREDEDSFEEVIAAKNQVLSAQVQEIEELKTKLAQVGGSMAPDGAQNSQGSSDAALVEAQQRAVAAEEQFRQLHEEFLAYQSQVAAGAVGGDSQAEQRAAAAEEQVRQLMDQLVATQAQAQAAHLAAETGGDPSAFSETVRLQEELVATQNMLAETQAQLVEVEQQCSQEIEKANLAQRLAQELHRAEEMTQTESQHAVQELEGRVASLIESQAAGAPDAASLESEKRALAEKVEQLQQALNSMQAEDAEQAQTSANEKQLEQSLIAMQADLKNLTEELEVSKKAQADAEAAAAAAQAAVAAPAVAGGGGGWGDELDFDVGNDQGTSQELEQARSQISELQGQVTAITSAKAEVEDGLAEAKRLLEEAQGKAAADLQNLTEQLESAKKAQADAEAAAATARPAAAAPPAAAAGGGDGGWGDDLDFDMDDGSSPAPAAAPSQDLTNELEQARSQVAEHANMIAELQAQMTALASAKAEVEKGLVDAQRVQEEAAARATADLHNLAEQLAASKKAQADAEAAAEAAKSVTQTTPAAQPATAPAGGDGAGWGDDLDFDFDDDKGGATSTPVPSQDLTKELEQARSQITALQEQISALSNAEQEQMSALSDAELQASEQEALAKQAQNEIAKLQQELKETKDKLQAAQTAAPVSAPPDDTDLQATQTAAPVSSAPKEDADGWGDDDFDWGGDDQSSTQQPATAPATASGDVVSRSDFESLKVEKEAIEQQLANNNETICTLRSRAAEQEVVAQQAQSEIAQLQQELKEVAEVVAEQAQSEIAQLHQELKDTQDKLQATQTAAPASAAPKKDADGWGDDEFDWGGDDQSSTQQLATTPATASGDVVSRFDFESLKVEKEAIEQQLANNNETIRTLREQVDTEQSINDQSMQGAREALTFAEQRATSAENEVRQLKAQVIELHAQADAAVASAKVDSQAPAVQAPAGGNDGGGGWDNDMDFDFDGDEGGTTAAVPAPAPAAAPDLTKDLEAARAKASEQEVAAKKAQAEVVQLAEKLKATEEQLQAAKKAQADAEAAAASGKPTGGPQSFDIAADDGWDFDVDNAAPGADASPHNDSSLIHELEEARAKALEQEAATRKAQNEAAQFEEQLKATLQELQVSMQARADAEAAAQAASQMATAAPTATASAGGDGDGWGNDMDFDFDDQGVAPATAAPSQDLAKELEQARAKAAEQEVAAQQAQNEVAKLQQELKDTQDKLQATQTAAPANAAPKGDADGWGDDEFDWGGDDQSSTQQLATTPATASGDVVSRFDFESLKVEKEAIEQQLANNNETIRTLREQVDTEQSINDQSMEGAREALTSAEQRATSAENEVRQLKAQVIELQAASQTPAVQAPAGGNDGGGGWDNDMDFDFDGDEGGTTAAAPAPAAAPDLTKDLEAARAKASEQEAAAKKAQTEVVQLAEKLKATEQQLQTAKKAQADAEAAAAAAQAAPSAATASAPAGGDDGGWGDDDLDFDFDEEGPAKPAPGATPDLTKDLEAARKKASEEEAKAKKAQDEIAQLRQQLKSTEEKLRLSKEEASSQKAVTASAPVVSKDDGDGWGDDEFDFDDEDAFAAQAAKPALVTSSSAGTTNEVQELRAQQAAEREELRKVRLEAERLQEEVASIEAQCRGHQRLAQDAQLERDKDNRIVADLKRQNGELEDQLKTQNAILSHTKDQLEAEKSVNDERAQDAMRKEVHDLSATLVKERKAREQEEKHLKAKVQQLKEDLEKQVEVTKSSENVKSESKVLLEQIDLLRRQRDQARNIAQAIARQTAMLSDEIYQYRMSGGVAAVANGRAHIDPERTLQRGTRSPPPEGLPNSQQAPRTLHEPPQPVDEADAVGSPDTQVQRPPDEVTSGWDVFDPDDEVERTEPSTHPAENPASPGTGPAPEVHQRTGPVPENDAPPESHVDLGADASSGWDDVDLAWGDMPTSAPGVAPERVDADNSASAAPESSHAAPHSVGPEESGPTTAMDDDLADFLRGADDLL